MKHKKIINQIYNYIKNIDNFDYKNMITDPNRCLQDHKDFFDPNYNDKDDNEYSSAEWFLDRDTSIDLARFAILKKLQRDLQIKWCKRQIKQYQETREFKKQLKLAKENKEFVTISCEFLKDASFSSCSVLSEATAPKIQIFELKNGNYIIHYKIK